ncbi:ribbon-helix-helix domain-containing protein, partial [Erysipelatoclostridium ramosum]|uniref:ribbon-helix-helix protein, CopG family n=1 Tax=Thomasclavelia ramosa TaxID=1547 RepID=UPI001D0813A9
MKKRINVTISEELLEKVDSKCNEMGVSRSSYICNKVASAIAQEDLTMQSMIAAAKEVMQSSINSNEVNKDLFNVSKSKPLLNK